MSDYIDVLLVDDSAVVRGLLARALETDPSICISGTAMHGEAALRWMESHPVHVVVLDVEMPVMDGLTALQKIQELYPDVHCIMASSLTFGGAETTVKALSLGAAGCIAKPVANSVAESVKQLTQELVPLVKALGESCLSKKTAPETISREPDKRAYAPTATQVKQPLVPPKILAIGSSTGGPQALREVLTGLPKDFSLPIFITQHMPPMFTPMLAQHIEKDTGRPCAEGTDGGIIENGHTYIAPGDFHMTIDKQDGRMIMRLNQEPQEHFCRPSVNPMFRTISEWYGKGVLGVMLTGMGDDGIEGTQQLVDNGGYMIAQDEESSVVWGMPGAVARKDLAHQVLPLKKIASSILHLTQREVARI